MIFIQKARIQTIDTTKFEDCWDEGIIPVIAGQGVSSTQGKLQPRVGGSDTAAVAIKVALKAGFWEINTDVDGVYSTDPTICKEAKLIKKMDSEVALEMASLGSKVLHARCAELGAKYKMPIVVRNNFKPNDNQRTLIMSLNKKEVLEAPVQTGITLDRNIAIFNLKADIEGKSDIISEVFKTLAHAEVNVDIIVHNRLSSNTKMSVGFSVGVKEAQKVHNAQKCTNIEIAETKGLSKISAVGLGMQSHPGVASSFFRRYQTLKLQTYDFYIRDKNLSGDPHEDLADQAVRILHESSLTNKKEKVLTFSFLFTKTSNDANHAFDLIVS